MIWGDDWVDGDSPWSEFSGAPSPAGTPSTVGNSPGAAEAPAPRRSARPAAPLPPLTPAEREVAAAGFVADAAGALAPPDGWLRPALEFRAAGPVAGPAECAAACRAYRRGRAALVALHGRLDALAERARALRASPGPDAAAARQLLRPGIRSLESAASALRAELALTKRRVECYRRARGGPSPG